MAGKKKIIIKIIFLLVFTVLSLFFRIKHVRTERLFTEANIPDRSFTREIDKSMTDYALTSPVFTDDLDTPFIIEFRKRYAAAPYFQNGIVTAVISDCRNVIKHEIPCTKKDVENLYQLAVRGDLFSLAVFPRLRNDMDMPLFPLLMESARKGEVVSLMELARFYAISDLELDAKALEGYAEKIIENRAEPMAYNALSFLYAKQGREEEFCDISRKEYALFGLKSVGAYLVNENEMFDKCGIFDNTKSKDEILKEINTLHAKILLAYRYLLYQTDVTAALAIFDEVAGIGEITEAAVSAEFCKGILLYKVTQQKELGMRLIKESYDKGYISAYPFITVDKPIKEMGIFEYFIPLGQEERLGQTPLIKMPSVYEVNIITPAICSLVFNTEARKAAEKALKGAKEKDFQTLLKEGY